MIFNKNNAGGTELRDLLGFIDAGSNFEKWKTWISLSVRQVTALTGKAVYDVADAHYNSANYGNVTTPEFIVLNTLVAKFQLPNALFAYVRLLPSLDAGHSNAGRLKTVGSEERTLTAVEAYKDETNILNLGYEALEDLLSYLEENAIPTWIASETRKSTANLLVPNLSTFNEYFIINSARFYYTLVPMIKEVQNLQIVPVISVDRVTEILVAVEAAEPDETQVALLNLLKNYIQRPMVLATMVLALKRLSVELMPEGVVQTQIVGTVKEKLVANESTRKMLIASLNEDVEAGLFALQEQIKILDAPVVVVDPNAVVTPVVVLGNGSLGGFSF